jgi:DNA-binding NtrC family response regulator
VVERAVALAPGSTVEESDLPDKLIVGARIAPAEPQAATRATLDEVARSYVLQVLDQVRGNKSEAARVLGIPRRTLYRMLERYESGESSAAAVSRPGTSVH